MTKQRRDVLIGALVVVVVGAAAVIASANLNSRPPSDVNQSPLVGRTPAQQRTAAGGPFVSEATAQLRALTAVVIRARSSWTRRSPHMASSARLKHRATSRRVSPIAERSIWLSSKESSGSRAPALLTPTCGSWLMPRLENR